MAANIESNPLREAVHDIMFDPNIKIKYPDGLTGTDVLNEIRIKNPNAFPYCTMLDVIDELTAIFGPRN